MGYFDDIPWLIDVYHQSLNVPRLRLRLALEGMHAPVISNACEIGFGQGLTLAINSAAFPAIRWHGADHNIGHVDFCRNLTFGLANQPDIHCQTFEQYSDTCTDQFDLIGFMGCWSWVSGAQRQVVIDFVEKRLKPGGVFVFNYLSHPGQAHFAAFRQFVLDCASDGDKANSSSGTSDRFARAMDQAAEVLKLNPWYLRANPDVAEFFENSRKKPLDHFVHEYLNENWQPMSFMEVAKSLGKAGLAYAGSAEFGEYDKRLHLDERQMAHLRAIEDVNLRETSEDFIRMRDARMDYWIKSGKPMTAQERQEILEQTRLVLTADPNSAENRIEGTLGEFFLNADHISALTRTLFEKPGSTLMQLHRLTGIFPDDFEEFLALVVALIGKKVISPLNAIDLANPVAIGECDAINRRILTDPDFAEIHTLASPVCGALAVKPTTKYFLQSQLIGHGTPAEMASFAHGEMAKLPAERADRPTLNELVPEAEGFVTRLMPVLNQLKLFA